MNILYGIQGTGNGHISRARVLAKALNQRTDVSVDYLFSGRPKDKYFDMACFPNYTSCQGLTFVTSSGQVAKLSTAANLNLKQFWRDIKQLDLTNYDLVLNDFEPVSAWAAKKQNVPSLSISHQAALGFDIPKPTENFLDKIITRYFAPTTYSLGVHWHHFGKSIMPPLIDIEEVNVESQTEQKYVLVYLPFENMSAVQSILSPLKQDFISYHPNISTTKQIGNVLWKPLSKTEFIHALVSSQGVIANGGFELASECLLHGKKLLIKPLKGQFEQSSNLAILQKMGSCSPMHSLSSTCVEKWLVQKNTQPAHFPTDANTFIDWLLEKQWGNTRPLCDTLWSQVSYPPHIQQRIDALL